MDSEDDEFLKPAEPANTSTPRQSVTDLQRSSLGVVSPPAFCEDEAGVADCSESGDAAEPSTHTDLKNKCLLCATDIEEGHPKVHNSIASIADNINSVYG